MCTGVTASVEAQFNNGAHQFKLRSGSVCFKGKTKQPESRVHIKRDKQILTADVFVMAGYTLVYWRWCCNLP